MRFAMYIVMLLVAICALFADTHALPQHRLRLPGSGPGYGPFNPRQPWPIPLPNVSILINIISVRIRKIFDFPFVIKIAKFMFSSR